MEPIKLNAQESEKFLHLLDNPEPCNINLIKAMERLPKAWPNNDGISRDVRPMP